MTTPRRRSAADTPHEVRVVLSRAQGPACGRAARSRTRGQSMLELALVLPILMVLFGGAVQFGVFFAAQNSLTQVARDTARWAATQAFSPCSQAATNSPSPLLVKADEIATNASLIGYTSGMWNAANFKSSPDAAYVDNASLPASAPNDEGVEVIWSWESGGACPPADNVLAAYVTIRVTHSVPVLLPGLQYLPGIGMCNASGCHLRLTSTAVFRMEPPRQVTGP